MNLDLKSGPPLLSYRVYGHPHEGYMRESASTKMDFGTGLSLPPRVFAALQERQPKSVESGANVRIGDKHHLIPSSHDNALSICRAETCYGVWRLPSMQICKEPTKYG